MSRLDEIKARLSHATKGPWYDDDAISGDGSVVMSEATGLRVAHLPETERVKNHEADSEFIAHSHADVEWMVARIEKLGAALRVELPTYPLGDPKEHDSLCGLVLEETKECDCHEGAVNRRIRAALGAE